MFATNSLIPFDSETLLPILDSVTLVLSDNFLASAAGAVFHSISIAKSRLNLDLSDEILSEFIVRF